jgi:pimeloyl-ACP methyl ester carboxylesterase
MPDSDATIHTLDVPGARLYYERRGSGPLLLMIGSPMDSTGFAPLADALADDYTVVTYDPRGIGNSSLQDTTQDVTPEQQAEDVHRLLSALGGQPADVFGSSGGAVVGLALVTAHPDQVRTLVAHEPPVVELLPDRVRVRAQIQDIYDTYRADGADKAMQKFMAHAGLGDALGQEDAARWEPSPEEMARAGDLGSIGRPLAATQQLAQEAHGPPLVWLGSADCRTGCAITPISGRFSKRARNLQRPLAVVAGALQPGCSRRTRAVIDVGNDRTAAEGGADRRSARRRGRADPSIAPSAPYGRPHQSPRGSHANMRSDRKPASEAGGRAGVCPGLHDDPHRRSLTGGAHSSSRLAPMRFTQSSR